MTLARLPFTKTVADTNVMPATRLIRMRKLLGVAQRWLVGSRTTRAALGSCAVRLDGETALLEADGPLPGGGVADELGWKLMNWTGPRE